MSLAQHPTASAAIAPDTTHPPVGLTPKVHYEILDGLRGVAAVMVVIFHLFEPWDGEVRFRQIINHGYLAVDFFFLLSGFVLAYAYDDRWPRMSRWEFFKRRLIRLQPLVIVGNVIGALFFYFGGGATFPLIAGTPVWRMLLVMVVGFTMVPLLPSMDIRGWQEMYPLDAPAWSLFFEYLANIAYALGLRRVSNRVLGALTFLAGLFLVHYLLFGGRGDVIGGWSLAPRQLHVGFARLLFPFLAGMLLQRLGKRISVGSPFLLSSALLIVCFSLPRFGGPAHLWWNGLYEAFCIILLFPLIVAIGAGGNITSGRSLQVCRFLGALSYPLYITHFALIDIYTAWIGAGLAVGRGILYGVLLFAAALVIAYSCLKLIDEPVRAWLTRRFLPRGAAPAVSKP